MLNMDLSRTGRRRLLVRAWPVIVVVAAFGPYLTNGVRTEQLVVYGSLLAALPFLVSRLRFGGLYACVLGLWALLAFSIIINPDRSAIPGRFLPGSPLSGVDSYLYPLAVLLLVSCWMATGYTRLALLDVVCKAFVALAAGNGIIAFTGLFVNPTGWLQKFWGYAPATVETTVAVRAFSNGRLTGIFAQPAEAGIAYSLALFAAVYLFARPGRDRPVPLGLVATPVLVGGVLSASKMFLLVGMPLALWQAVRQGRRVRRVLVIVGMAGMIRVALTQVDIPQWRGAWMLSMLFSGNDGSSTVEKYTAGRLGSNGASGVAFDYVLATQPWFGYGAGGLAVSYDSSWVEAVIVGGIVGVVLFALVLAVLIGVWISGRPAPAGPQRPFATSVLGMSVAATAGLPAFTANRVALFIWIFLALLFLVDESRPDNVRKSVGAPLKNSL
ncbi:hypothetical protein [Candidatus Protofrankia californiensis]|uniref:hypothetical protein n=1 Tax=Candidatus Protofrankia californiensis TaxID=1839754 RepID=UPI0019D11129|nr:hypothetical protein [Candidatus Protofrankia californiensis]